MSGLRFISIIDVIFARSPKWSFCLQCRNVDEKGKSYQAPFDLT